jgi:hypothetical protein
MFGSWPSNVTSTTAPMTWLMRPVAPAMFSAVAPVVFAGAAALGAAAFFAAAGFAAAGFAAAGLAAVFFGAVAISVFLAFVSD